LCYNRYKEIFINEKQKNMKSKIASIICIVFIVCLTAMMSAHGALTGTVTATVTVENVSVTVADGGVAFGTIAVNTAANSCSDSQTVTNAGNVNEDFTIEVANSANWTVGAATDSNVFIASFKAAACPYTGSTQLTAADAPLSLATNKAAEATVTLNVGITTPTASTNYTAQSIVFTVTASATS
jgi:hypothetical protein